MKSNLPLFAHVASVANLLATVVLDAIANAIKRGAGTVWSSPGSRSFLVYQPPISRCWVSNFLGQTTNIRVDCFTDQNGTVRRSLVLGLCCLDVFSSVRTLHTEYQVTSLVICQSHFTFWKRPACSVPDRSHAREITALHTDSVALWFLEFC